MRKSQNKIESSVTMFCAFRPVLVILALTFMASTVHAAPKFFKKPAEVGNFTLMDDLKLSLTGFLDLGVFSAQGDGVAYVRDANKLSHPGFRHVPWVFTGDPWSNAINSQGDSADLGLDRTNIARHDPIQSGGATSFLVNTVNLGLKGSVRDEFLFEVSINFEPRTGSVGSSGDQVDVDLAYVEWRPMDDWDLSIFVGKSESVFGREYRTRQAPDRLTVTPSIIGRYTSGTPLGVRMRLGVAEKLLVLAASATNGAPTVERFWPFGSEIDRNHWKTLTGRLSTEYVSEDGSLSYDVGFSAAFGAQDGQTDDEIAHWQIGADLKLVWEDLTIEAEIIRVRIDPDQVGENWLRADGWYGLAYYQVSGPVGVYGRVGRRDAQMLSWPNAYITHTMRYTAGARFDLTFNVIAKVEYTHIRELTNVEIPDDVATGSLVFRF